MKTYQIYPRVSIEKGVTIGDYVVIGLPPRGKKPGQLKTVIGKNALIRSHTIIYAGNKIGDYFETGHYVFIRENNIIENEVRVGTFSAIEHHVHIENMVHIHSRVFIPEFTVLEKGCWIGPGVVLTNTPHPLCPRAKECLRRGCRVKKFAKIGANATLLPHISIGEFSVVGAGSVVTEDVPAKKVAIGNPAKIVKDVKDLRCHYNKLNVPYNI